MAEPPGREQLGETVPFIGSVQVTLWGPEPPNETGETRNCAQVPMSQQHAVLFFCGCLILSQIVSLRSFQPLNLRENEGWDSEAFAVSAAVSHPRLPVASEKCNARFGRLRLTPSIST